MKNNEIECNSKCDYVTNKCCIENRLAKNMKYIS